MSTELSLLDQVRERILTLDAALTANNPNIDNLMRVIHKDTLANQQVVQSLTDEEIAIIVAGYSEVSRIKIAETAGKSAGKTSTAKLRQLTIDDI